MTNRHDRRREAAMMRAWTSFQARANTFGFNNKDAAEGFMRAEQFKDSGFDRWIIAPPTVPEHERRMSPDDIVLGVQFDELEFRASIKADFVPQMLENWPKFSDLLAEKLGDPDPRSRARSAIIAFMTAGRHFESNGAVIVTGAMLWLASTAPTAPLMPIVPGCGLNYFITPFTEGRPGHNFRLSYAQPESDEVAAIRVGTHRADVVPVPQSGEPPQS